MFIYGHIPENNYLLLCYYMISLTHIVHVNIFRMSEKDFVADQTANPFTKKKKVHFFFSEMKDQKSEFCCTS